jgi:4-hydroxy-4-methyl-2-oxoglutarate aldolase
MLSARDLEALAKISSPTISNAIEMFEVRPRNEGFIGPEVQCIFPGLGRMVGYASTAVLTADLPAKGKKQMSRREYWEATQNVPAPRIAVIQDLDNPAGRGSFWGEVNSNIHRSLGFIGTVTNGSARDLDEMEALGFYVFASTPSVSHACAHLVDCGGPVRIGGAVISPGDLLHGDRHGVVIIPAEIAAETARAAVEVDDAERALINYCKSGDFSLEGLVKAQARLEERFQEMLRRNKNR